MPHNSCQTHFLIMQDDLLGLLRREIEKAKPRRFDPDLHPKQPLEHGWLLPYLLLADDFTWKRWSYWHDVMQSRRVIGDTIPRIEWQSNPHARKMLENSLNSITRYGGWQGWGSWNFFSYFMDWLLFGFGHGGHKVLPKEPSGAEGASDRLYQVFNIETLLAYPHDYLGDILCENQHGQRSGFFPTPMSVVEMLVLMTVDGDARLKTVCDPCVGTGRMLMVASNYSLRLYGVDIDPTVIKATLVNGYLFAPWLVKPFPFLDGANLDPTQTIAISNALASHKPDYHQETVPSPNGQEYAPIKRRIRESKAKKVYPKEERTAAQNYP